jgi:hypothetical protein
MSLRRWMTLLMLNSAISVVIVLFIIANYAQQSFWLLGVPAFAFGLYSFSQRCPECGEFAWRKRRTVAGTEVVYWGGLPPRECSRCGCSFETRLPGKKAKAGRPKAVYRPHPPKHFSVHFKIYFLLAVAGANVLGGLGLARVTTDPVMAAMFRWVAVGVPMALVGYILTLRCDHCGRSVFFGGSRPERRTHRSVRGLLFRDRCAWCDADFRAATTSTPLRK